MNLADASRYFDRTTATDVVTGKTLFRCQIDPFDESKRDAAAAYRRVMSVAPGTAMPSNNVAVIMGRVWMIGGYEPDGLEDLHRVKYVVQAASVQLKVSRLNLFLSGAYSSETYACPTWTKDAKQLEVSSETPQIFDVTLPLGTDVHPDDVLWGSATAYLVLASHPQASGMLVANCLKLDQSAPLQATISTRTYDPVTGTYGAPVDTLANSLLVRWQSLFKYGSQMSERYQEGDVSIVLPAGTVVTTSTKITLSGVSYQVLAVLDIAGAVVAHARVS
jgi:hypothetical protein